MRFWDRVNSTEEAVHKRMPFEKNSCGRNALDDTGMGNTWITQYGKHLDNMEYEMFMDNNVCVCGGGGVEDVLEK